MDSLALYIHIPYCLEKCPYCDFHSIATEKRSIPEGDYLSCLLAQLNWEKERLSLKGRKFLSVFFGGGTPSLMNPQFFGRIIEFLSNSFVLDEGVEITVETNPTTASKLDFQEWLQVGINRISFGVQSFQDPLLKKLGRNHSSLDARKAIQSALEAKFSNVSLDLVFGIEGQNLEALEEDLKTAISFDLPHISAYQLTVEAGTLLASWVQHGSFKQPEEETTVNMYSLIVQMLESHGWTRYEISNYAKSKFESRHNLQYWKYGEYLGVGSGAVSFMGRKRWRTTRKLKNYLQKRWDYEDEEYIDSKTARKEKWMMGLRLKEGVLLDDLDKDWIYQLSPLEKEGFLKRDEKRVHLTSRGFYVYNKIVQNIFDLMNKVC